MKNIDKIYRDIIMNGYYDEAYGMKSEVIDGKMHGVCIDFSRQLIEKLKKDGYSAGLISTLNDDGFLHAAVLYRNMQSGELRIADPVTDIRRLTDLDNNQRRLEIKRILGDNNWCRDLKEYIEEFGAITEYYDNMSKAVDSVIDKEKLESHPSIIDFEKRGEQIQTLKRLSQLTSIADGPTLLACQTLYKKGIDTFCTNYDPKTKYTAINIRYNSLSDENKKILQELLRSKPDNYVLQADNGFYGELLSNKHHHMFFENEKEAELYAKGLVSSELQYDNEDYIITPTDIAKTSKLYGIGNKIVQRFKAMIEKVKEMWR